MLPPGQIDNFVRAAWEINLELQNNENNPFLHNKASCIFIPLHLETLRNRLPIFPPGPGGSSRRLNLITQIPQIGKGRLMTD